MVGDEEQATGGADGPDEAGKIILETLRIFGLALRGPRSCCTATQVNVDALETWAATRSLPSLFMLTRKHRANRQERH